MQAAHAGEAAQGTEEAAATAEQRVAEARRSGALEAEAARTKLRASAERAEGLERSQRPGALAEAWSARRDGIVGKNNGETVRDYSPRTKPLHGVELSDVVFLHHLLKCRGALLFDFWSA